MNSGDRPGFEKEAAEFRRRNSDPKLARQRLAAQASD